MDTKDAHAFGCRIFIEADLHIAFLTPVRALGVAHDEVVRIEVVVSVLTVADDEDCVVCLDVT